jgi:ligand-binding SRPBCC domain-containing protein
MMEAGRHMHGLHRFAWIVDTDISGYESRSEFVDLCIRVSVSTICA